MAPFSEMRVAVGDSADVYETTDMGRDRGVRRLSSFEAVGKRLGEPDGFGAGCQTSDGSRIPTPFTSSVRFRNWMSVQLSERKTGHHSL